MHLIYSSISKIILHHHYSLLEFVFDLFIKAQPLTPCMLSDILILYLNKIVDTWPLVTDSVICIQCLAKITLLLHDLVALLRNLLNLHIYLGLCSKLKKIQLGLTPA